MTGIWGVGGATGYAALLIAILLLAMLFSKRKKTAKGFASRGWQPEQSDVPTARFDDVAANDEAMNSLRDLLDFIRSPEKYARMGAHIPRGVLLYGQPGTGKTLMARALAGEAGVPFFAVNGADFVEMYVGVGASRVRALFRKARKAGRAVIFFDEIDAIGARRAGQSEESDRTLNALLSEMSGFRERDGVVVLAATNRLDALDEALLRAGRFDRQIETPLPGLDERRKILEKHARNKPLGADVSRALETSLFGEERRDLNQLAQERELTAAHEAGHALLTALLLPDSRLRKVSIIPTGMGAAGYSMAVPPERLFHSRQELMNHMAVALAGREAGKLLVGADRVTTGAAGDIEKAATLARRMVCEWGMLPQSDEVYLFSQAQKDAAAQSWLGVAQQLAAGMLRRYLPAWKRLTALLLRRETLGADEVQGCIACEENAAG